MNKAEKVLGGFVILKKAVSRMKFTRYKKSIERREKEERRIMDKYPNIFPVENKGLSLEIGAGWLSLVDELCMVLDRICKTSNVSITAMQVKEKFGSLRFYFMLEYPEDINEEGAKKIKDSVGSIINMYECASSKICEICGKPGERVNNGWVSIRCEKHQTESCYD